MTELERSLAALASRIDWPATPSLTIRFEPQRGRSRRILVAVALTALALVVSFAVPEARSAILRFFHLDGVTIERVATLPAAQERPLAATLGHPVTQAEAAGVLGGAVRLPPTDGHPRLYRQGRVISVLLATPTQVLLSELNLGGNTFVLKKLLAGSTAFEWVQVTPDAPGAWITGEEHVFIGPNAPPRLAGNVLLWQRGEITYRLEGKGLSKDEALRLAREILG